MIVQLPRMLAHCMNIEKQGKVGPDLIAGLAGG